MSLNWDNIDTRQQKAKKDAKDLKEYLVNQQEEVRMRKQQERINERESFKTNVFNQKPILTPSFIKKQEASQSSDPPRGFASSSSPGDNWRQPSLGPKQLYSRDSPLPMLAGEYDGSLVSRMNQIIPDINTRALSKTEYSNGNGTDDFLMKWKAAEDQSIQDRRSRNILENELSSTKLIITSLSGKLELLQDQFRNENSNVKDVSRMFAQKERESRDAIDILSKKLEQESKKVHVLVEELSRSRQNDAVLNHQLQDQIRMLQEKSDAMANRLEGYAEKSNQVGFSLNSTSNQLLLESRRNEDTVKAIKMHDMALSSLSSNLDSNLEGVKRKIQNAANDLFQRIDSESRARKGLEDGIRQDALEFRRMIERHVAERVDSIHSYTVAQSEHDRKEIEGITSAINTKLHKLEATTSVSHEQFAAILNQRLQIIESNLVEQENSSKKLESRLQASIAESLQFFENVVNKKDADNEKRLKDVSKSILAMQKAIHDSISIAEKTMEGKMKSLQDVLRAEIATRTELDSKVGSLAHESKAAFEGQNGQISKLFIQLEEAKQEQKKTLALIKNVAQQLTVSQDRWVANFESETAKIADSVHKQTTQLLTAINQSKTHVLQIHDDFVLEAQENHAQIVLEIEEVKTEADKIKLVLNSMDTRFDSLVTEFDGKFGSSAARFDSTMEAFKVELAARPTHSSVEDRITELENEQQEEHKNMLETIEEMKSEQVKLAPNSKLKALEEKIAENRSTLAARCIAIEELANGLTKSLTTFVEEDQVVLKQAIEKQIESLSSKQDEIQQQVSNAAQDFSDFKATTDDALDAGRGLFLSFETQIESIQQILRECDNTMKDFKEEQELMTKQAGVRDEKISSLKVEFNKDSEELSRKIIEAFDENQKTHAHANAEIKKVSDFITIAKSNIEKVSEQVVHLRDSVESQGKSQKQSSLETSKRFDDLFVAIQSQLENNGRKISQLGITFESQVMQNQNEHEMIREDVLFAKRLLGNGNETSQISGATEGEIMKQIQKSSVLLEETRKDMEDFAYKAQAFERSVTTRFSDMSNTAEKNNFENQAQVEQLSDLVTKIQQQLGDKVKDNSSNIETMARDVRSLKADINQIELDQVRVQGDIGRLARNITSPKEELVKPLTAKLDALSERVDTLEGTTPRPKTGGDEEGAKGTMYKPASVSGLWNKSRGTPKTEPRAGASLEDDRGEIDKAPLAQQRSIIEF